MFKTVFKIENEALIVQLSNKKKHNNNVNVICEISEKVAVPYFDNVEEKWVVPNDVVGLESKKLKSVKIRFHPSVIELSAKDANIHQAACQSAIKYLDCLLEESEWTRQADNDEKLFDSQLNSLVSILWETDKIVDFNKNQIVFSFLQNEFWDDLIKLISCKSLRNHFFTTVVDNGDEQVLHLVFENDQIKRNILKIVIDSGYLDSNQNNVLCDIEISKSCVSWILKKSETDSDHAPPKVTQKLDCYIIVNDVEQEMPVYSPCYSIFHMTEQLNNTLQGLPNNQGSLTKLSQNLAKNVIISLDKNESPHLSKLVYTITSTPLIVDCDFDSTITSQTESELTWSPTDSIDSGVSLSPTLSIEDSYYSPSMISIRERSRSESGEFNCYQRLKGILKWPQRYHGLNRSYSECHDDSGSLSPIYQSISPPFFENDEDIFQEDEENGTLVGVPTPRKKSVSFSEKIDKRVFNSNTSIETQKRKNLKKNEKKKKRDDISRGDSIEELCNIQSGPIVMKNRHVTV